MKLKRLLAIVFSVSSVLLFCNSFLPAPKASNIERTVSHNYKKNETIQENSSEPVLSLSESSFVCDNSSSQTEIAASEDKTENGLPDEDKNITDSFDDESKSEEETESVPYDEPSQEDTVYEEQTIEPEVIQEPEYTIIYDIINLDTYIYDQLSGSIYSSSGCGPTSAAMLLSSERDIGISKDDIITTAYDNGFYYDVGVNFTSGRGVTLENIRDLINYYGQEAVIDHLWNYSNDDIVNTINSKLDEGHRLICGHRTFSGSLHYFVIYGKYRIDDRMYYNIVDPWGGSVYNWDQWTLTDRIISVGGNDDSTFEGCVKGLLWLD